jgi:hypothetical protein
VSETRAIPRQGFFEPPTDFASLPHGTNREIVSFRSEDGAQSHGTLYAKGGKRTVLCITHPRADLSRHYMTPALLEAGYAVCGFTHRAGTDDFAMAHETILLDIAGCIRMLKAERGFDKVVLLANSGGGGVFGLYQWQAEMPSPGRLTHTPAGDDHDLNNADLPPADGLILLATPFGESTVVTRGIDPSVTDEADPFSCNADLDMYDPRNGYRAPPDSSQYSAEFAARYREAQLARVARIDAFARSLIAEQLRWRAQLRDPGFAALPVDERNYILRRATDTRPVRVYRTDACLAYCDLSMHPSQRAVGNFLTLDPQPMNYARGTAGQLKSPRAWLSSASGLSSRSSLRQALPHIRMPTIILCYTADRGVYPDDVAEMLAISAAGDKQLHHIDGEHFGLPIDGVSERDPRGTVARILSGWLGERFPGRD